MRLLYLLGSIYLYAWAFALAKFQGIPEPVDVAKQKYPRFFNLRLFNLSLGNDKQNGNSMDYLKAKELREKWENKPCNHLKFEKETHRDTEGIDVWDGDYVCVQCGEDFTPKEVKNIREK